MLRFKAIQGNLNTLLAHSVPVPVPVPVSVSVSVCMSVCVCVCCVSVYVCVREWGSECRRCGGS